MAIAQAHGVDYGMVLCAADAYNRQMERPAGALFAMGYWEQKAFADLQALGLEKSLILREAIKNQVVYEKIKIQRSLGAVVLG